MNVTYKGGLSVIKECGFNATKLEITKYTYLDFIEHNGSWKKKEFYEGEKDLFEKYKGASFSNFAYSAYKVSHKWYAPMKTLMKNTEFKKVVIKYGRDNAVTYMNSSPEERAAILDYADSYKGIVNFGTIKRKLFPAKAFKPNPVPDKVVDLKVKKEVKKITKKLEKKTGELKDSNVNLKTENEKLAKENAILKKRVAELEDAVDHLKKTVAIISGQYVEQQSKTK